MPAPHPRVAMITGENSGIGFVTAKKLAAHSFYIIPASRNQQKSAQAIARIRAGNQNQAFSKIL